MAKGNNISPRCEELLKRVKLTWSLIGWKFSVSNLFVCLLFTQQRSPQLLGLGPQVLECKLNPYWSKLRLKEKHDVMLFFLHMSYDSKNASAAKIGFHFRLSVAEIFNFYSHLGDTGVPLD